MIQAGAVTRETAVEDLLSAVPGVVRYLIDRGLPCLVCGEPIWGTFEDLARRNGKPEEEIERMLREINALRERRDP